MGFEGVYLVSNKLQIASEDEIEDLEKSLGRALPKGYADFVSTLGLGTYCDLLRVYLPERILKEREEVRQRWDQYYFWEDGRDVLTKEQVLECTIFADTIDGDEIIAHPEKPGRLFVLPRHDDLIYVVPRCFEAPLEWHGPKGIEREEPGFRYFESWVDREYREFFTAKELFSITDLAPYFADFWTQFGQNVVPDPGVKEESDEENVAILFVQGIGARLQLVQASGDGRMSVRIDYDADSESVVQSFVAFLTDMGFYETDVPGGGRSI